MFRTEAESRHLEFIRKHVRRLQPGQRIEFSRSMFREIRPYEHNGVTVTPPDQVLEGIMGSGYEFWYDSRITHVTFGRLESQCGGGIRSYVSPDRRDHYWRVDEGGLFYPRRSEHDLIR